jgi:uncharacterized membrane protein
MSFLHFEAHEFCTYIFFTIFAWILLKFYFIILFFWSNEQSQISKLHTMLKAHETMQEG